MKLNDGEVGDGVFLALAHEGGDAVDDALEGKATKVVEFGVSGQLLAE